MDTIRPLPSPEAFPDNYSPEPIAIRKWSAGYSKRTSDRTLQLYKDMEWGGGLSGGGESLRYTPSKDK